MSSYTGFHHIPLGATWDGHGAHFSVYSKHAEDVVLCLFDRPGQPETDRVVLQRGDAHRWHAYCPGLKPGQLYGFRAFGPFDPKRGHLFNPHKLLLDPYAKAVAGVLKWDSAYQGIAKNRIGDSCLRDDRDSAAQLPKCILMDMQFDWGDDRPPRIPWDQTVIYECHVKGMTQRHPDVPRDRRGSYLGMASEPIVNHLTQLGITAVELLPVQQFYDDERLVKHGLSNYWGYQSICFFAPEARYASGTSGQQVTEFKQMVRALHQAGIEVLLDVVYNHTGEGGMEGPTVCFRGLDNASYYRLDPEDPNRYWDCTGCGNSLNTVQPVVVQLIMDSLRFWVQEMHVDGFRFDLAPALARSPYEIDRWGRFWSLLQQDPVLSQVKLIAEPWDVGPDGYQLGAFPPGWSEWNDRYRDGVRHYWRGDPGQISRITAMLAGSSEVFMPSGRHAHASINYIASHDGSTLQDVVTYRHKYNESNQENNGDGHYDNVSCNWGQEGPTDDPDIQAQRERVKRSMLATLAFSMGVPMIAAGDEFGRTQCGNNNAYCQDNELSWLDWSMNSDRQNLMRFVGCVLKIRKDIPAFRRSQYYTGFVLPGSDFKDVVWLRADGMEMGDRDWDDERQHALGMLVPAASMAQGGFQEQADPSRAVLLIVNGGRREVRFRLPRVSSRGKGQWKLLVHTASPDETRTVTSATIAIPASTLLLLAGPSSRRRVDQTARGRMKR